MTMQAYTHRNSHDFLEIAYVGSDAELDALELYEPSRAEWADAYAPNQPPASAWMENGFSHTCAWCEHMLSAGGDCVCDSCYDDAPDEAAAEALSEIVFDGDFVYCSQRCLNENNNERERHRAAKETAKAALLAKYPFVTVTSAWIGGPGGCNCFRSNHDNACVHFTFEGSNLGGHSNVYCDGCKKAWVCVGDLAAFKELAGKAVTA